MTCDEGRLMAYVDDELPAEKRAEVAEHLRECAECAATVARLEADRDVAAQALASLEPVADVVPLPVPAAAVPASPAAARPAMQRNWGRYVAAVAAVLVLASFAFAPVRGAAASLLQVFRVQRVQTVSVSAEDLQSIAKAVNAGDGHVDLKSFGEVWVDGGRAKATTVTLDQAQAAVDFPVVLPPSDAGTPVLMLRQGQTYKFKLKVAAINDLLTQYGATKMLPDALDGQVFSVKVPSILLAQYPLPASVNTSGWPSKARGVFVGQARSPELTVPDGVDPAQLRDVLLNLPFLPASVRNQLAAVDDWQSTLIIPNVDGTARDVMIGGVSAVVISPKSAARDVRKKLGGPIPDSTTIIWNDNGVIRAVGGPIDEAAATSLAKSMMR